MGPTWGQQDPGGPHDPWYLGSVKLEDGLVQKTSKPIELAIELFLFWINQTNSVCWCKREVTPLLKHRGYIYFVHKHCNLPYISIAKCRQHEITTKNNSRWTSNTTFERDSAKKM